MTYLVQWINHFGFQAAEFKSPSQMNTFVDLLLQDRFEMVHVSVVKEVAEE